MNVLDLFSGIGGFSLGLERAGMTTVGFCEVEQYPISILKKHWPDIPVFDDIKEVKGDEILQQVGQVDLICGGFPCQPFSVAGKQRGAQDDRHLWPYMLRLISEIRPRWVIAENVAGFIPMGLDSVLSDLEAEGYETQSLVIPACAVGGVHRRNRVWIVAYTVNFR
ncbi:MAG: DNA cytosine methyltransferase [Methylococcales bacterium]|jgi:DNA (cytosine-5)-methyltransferase 1|nr:DNA cytosine methyltransferase [Methylococcales bacterium]